MKKKISGEVTVEAAIVVPLILLIVISLIYFAFCIHDILIIRSYAYSAGIESSACDLEDFSDNVKLKISKAPSLMITPIIECYQKNEGYFIEIKGVNSNAIKIYNNLIEGINIKLRIEKSIDRKEMYMIRSVIDFIGE